MAAHNHTITISSNLTPLFFLSCLDFDAEALQQQVDANCRTIVDEITSKFIDFGLEDNQSSYGNEESEKLTRLRGYFDNNTFNFETKCLDLPSGQADIDELLVVNLNSLQSMNTADTEMGSDLDDIFNILHSEAKDELSASNVIIEHRWNYKKAAFEK